MMCSIQLQFLLVFFDFPDSISKAKLDPIISSTHYQTVVYAISPHNDLGYLWIIRVYVLSNAFPNRISVHIIM
jgi:hypothetical protein